ncbi:MAG: succinylglutamate desuccinylase/aspartoacylase family protein [Xanthobacteraceae bacterium]
MTERKVISALNIDDLEPGKKHLFYLQGVQMVTGQHWYVSVMVAKGARPGKRIALVSGVHGDEISPVRTLQTVMDQLDPAAMSGAVLAVLDVSRRQLKAWRPPVDAIELSPLLAAVRSSCGLLRLRDPLVELFAQPIQAKPRP